MLKNIMNSKAMKIFLLLYAFFSLCIVLYVVNSVITKDYDEISQKTIIDKGWDVSFNGKKDNNVDITKYEFPDLSIGDKIIITTTVPAEWEYGHPGLTMYIRQTAIRVFIDEEIIYEYGYDRISQGKTVGTGYQIIDFSEDYKDKNMTIELQVSEKSPFKVLSPIYISESKNVIKQIVIDNRIPLVIGAFFIVLGFALSIVSMFAMIVSKKYMRILMLAAFSICIGIWTLCYYDLMNIFAMPVYTASLMEYMALFLMPIPLTAYMFWYTKALENNVLMNIYKVLYVNQILVSIIIIALHTLDIAHGPASLPYFQVYLVVWVLFSVFILYKNLRKKTGQTKVFLGGGIIVLICIMGDLLNYMSERYYGKPLFTIKGIFALGILIFLINILIDLYYEAVSHMIEDKEKQLLIDRAYKDGLTGLNNHRYCAEYMEKLDKNENEEYTIVSIDLNDLKKINDKYGHLRGDELIRQAADIIKEVFSDYGVVGRLGGDEFIVIMDKCEKEQVENLLKTFDRRMKENNISMAYGYAMATELEIRNTSKAYQLADERMYKHKRQIKSQNK